MDKSKEYIRMCRYAGEIQRLWQACPGDFFADRTNAVACWVPGACGALEIKKGFGVETGGKVIRITKYTWLPRHDQLMEMALKPATAFRDISFEFFRWTKEPYHNNQLFPGKVFTSLEQIWLAFIMNKKFQKLWKNRQWEKA